MRSVTIKKVKNIGNLCFGIPDPGVYVLTGSNGVGKTTLLAALHRIGFRNAFANFFKTTTYQRRLDYFGNSSITYQVGGKEVSYRYSNTRWSPTPRSNSELLKEFGFPEIKFIAADSKRIEATQDELNSNRINPVGKNTCKDIKGILSDPKFDDLKYVNTKRGAGNRAYLIAQKVGNRNFYFSEKNFSLGELCVLRLVTNLSDIIYNSLVLIDEIEMALHPRAQAALFNYLLRVAEEKKLTIIFSTHSTSLIKRATRKRIILLKNSGDGNIDCLRNVYPAQALGDIAYDDEINPDFLFFVEDHKAKQLLEQLINRYKSIAFKKLAAPYYKVLPVGGFKETIEFLSNSDQIFGDEVRRYAFLDKDVETESIEEAKKNEKYKFLQKVNDHKNQIKYLPCTPEVGIMDLINSDIIMHANEIRDLFDGYNIDISRILDDDKYIAIDSDKPRKKAKAQFDFIASAIAKRTGMPADQCERRFALHYVNSKYDKDDELHEQFGPIFNAK